MYIYCAYAATSCMQTIVIPSLIERGLYCNHLVRPSISPSVHTFVTDISASTGRNDCTSTSCLPCDLQMNEWGYS